MLSENELNAIQMLEKFTTEHKMFNIKNSDGLEKNIDIILNLITKLQKENEHLKNKFEEELEENRKNTCELLKQDLIIREKDKQIDLMTETIRKLSIALANYKGSYDKETINFTGNIEKIKQYFAELAKEKGE